MSHKHIESNIDRTVESVNYAVVVGSVTAVTLIPKDTEGVGGERLEITVSNPNNQAVYVRKYPAAKDSLKVGTYIPPNSSKNIVIGGTVYSGEVSVIMASGGSKIIIAEEI
jgi:hypothetical protein